MSYLSSGIRSMLQARITRKHAQLEAAYNALDAALDPERAPIQSYKFNSGEGDQYAVHRKPEEIQRLINTLENEIQRLYSRVNGTGIVNMDLRRRR